MSKKTITIELSEDVGKALLGSDGNSKDNATRKVFYAVQAAMPEAVFINWLHNASKDELRKVLEYIIGTVDLSGATSRKDMFNHVMGEDAYRGMCIKTGREW